LIVMTTRARIDTDRRRRTRGSSLAEVLVATAMGLFILGVAASFFGAQHGRSACRTRTRARTSLRVHRPDLAQLRMAVFDPTGAAFSVDRSGVVPGARPGLVGRPPRRSYRQDLNGDTDVDDTADVRYSMSNARSSARTSTATRSRS
jgi:hypothetical protein